MPEVKNSTEMEALVRRCVAGYPGAQAIRIKIISLAGHEPNWDCLVEYDTASQADDSLKREVAALKHCFRLAE